MPASAPPFASLAFPAPERDDSYDRLHVRLLEATTVDQRASRQVAIDAPTSVVTEPSTDSASATASADAYWRALVASSYRILHVDGHDIGLQKRQPTATLPDGRIVQIEWTPDQPEVVTWEIAVPASPKDDLDCVLRLATMALGGFPWDIPLDLLAKELRVAYGDGPGTPRWIRAWFSLYERRPL